VEEDRMTKDHDNVYKAFLKVAVKNGWEKIADEYGFASVTNITLFFDVHLGREREGTKKASYNCYNYALRDARMKVENRHPNCIYKHDPRQMPKVKESINHSSRKRNKKCGDDPKLDVYIGSWRNRYFLICAIGTFARKLLWELHHEQHEMTRKEFMEVDENGNSPYRYYKVLTVSTDAVQRKIIEKELLLGIDRTKTRHFRKDGMTLAQIMVIVKDAVIWLSGHSNERCNKSYVSSLSGLAI
jgi:hypothetical protein